MVAATREESPGDVIKRLRRDLGRMRRGTYIFAVVSTTFVLVVQPQLMRASNPSLWGPLMLPISLLMLFYFFYGAAGLSSILERTKAGRILTGTLALLYFMGLLNLIALAVATRRANRKIAELEAMIAIEESEQVRSVA